MSDEKITSLKAPPFSLEAEQSVIGAVLLRPDVLLDMALASTEFYRKEHRIIWSAIQSLHESRRAVDVLTVSEELTECGKFGEAGGLEYLAEIASNIQSAANVKHYVDIVRGRAIERKMISVGHALADTGYHQGSTLEKVSKAQAIISEFNLGLHDGDDSEPVHFDQCMKETVAKLNAQWHRPEGMLGLSTGFTDVDQRTGGLRNGDMIIIAGRPSQGKTTFAMNIAENAMLAGKFVIVFSLEMPRDALAQRMLASIGKVDHTRLQAGKFADDGEFSRFNLAATKVKNRNLYIDDRTGLTSAQLLPKARRIAHKLNRKVDLVVVDYMQLLRDKGDNQVHVVSEISRNMKNLAREMDCPALVLSQLNRGVEGRADKRPLMSDLRDSGSIEQDADIIFMTYRDEYYDEKSPHKGLMELICRKYRNGKVGTDILSSANLDQCRFENSTVKSILAQMPPLKRARGGYDY